MLGSGWGAIDTWAAINFNQSGTSNHFALAA